MCPGLWAEEFKSTYIAVKFVTGKFKIFILLSKILHQNSALADTSKNLLTLQISEANNYRINFIDGRCVDWCN